jgi:hypothetical protein
MPPKPPIQSASANTHKKGAEGGGPAINDFTAETVDDDSFFVFSWIVDIALLISCACGSAESASPIICTISESLYLYYIPRKLTKIEPIGKSRRKVEKSGWAFIYVRLPNPLASQLLPDLFGLTESGLASKFPSL